MRNRVIKSRKHVVFGRSYGKETTRDAQVNTNTKADWVEEVREVMKEIVPELPTEGFQQQRRKTQVR